jgi:hypothetical protein
MRRLDATLVAARQAGPPKKSGRTRALQIKNFVIHYSAVRQSAVQFTDILHMSKNHSLLREVYGTVCGTEDGSMVAERVIIEADEKGMLSGLPPVPAHSKVEVIMIVIDTPGVSRRHRDPPVELSRMTKITGDILSPAVAENEWEALR